MFELFYMGGPLFMSILSIQFIGVIVATIKYLNKSDKMSSDLDLIRSVGLFAMVTGILGQLIGLFSAFQAIEQAGMVAPAILMGGLKVSMITTLYGIIIFLIAMTVWFVLRLKK